MRGGYSRLVFCALLKKLKAKITQCFGLWPKAQSYEAQSKTKSGKLATFQQLQLVLHEKIKKLCQKLKE